MAEPIDVDSALGHLGRWSRWHIVNYTISGVMYGYIAMHMMAVVFVGLAPEFHCAIPEGVPYTIALPASHSDGESLARCRHYLNYSSATNITVDGCPMGWTYGDEVHSIVQEWDAVCDRGYMVSLSQTLLVTGIASGGLVLSPQIDRFGRKPVMFACTVLMSIAAFVNAWVNQYWLFLVFRFVIGVLQQGVMASTCVMAYELFTPADRSLPGVLFHMFFGIWAMGLALTAYFVRNWRNLLMVTAVPGVLFIPLFWVLPESLHFLVAQGRTEDALAVLSKAARMNKVTLPPSVLGQKEVEPFQKDTSSQNEKSATAHHAYSVVDICRSTKLLLYTLILAFLWCSVTFVYHALMLNTSALAGDPYINFLMSGLMDILAAWVTAIVAHRVGRRWLCFIFYMIAAVSVIVIVFIPATTSGGTNLHWLLVTLAMTGKFGISCCFWVIMIFSSEMYPTTLRGTGNGITSVGGRLANIIAPFTSLLIPLIPWLLNVIIGGACVLAAALVLLLPETLGRPLPQTITEVEQWTRTLTPREKELFKALSRNEQNIPEKEVLHRSCTPDDTSDTEKTDVNV